MNKKNAWNVLRQKIYKEVLIKTRLKGREAMQEAMVRAKKVYVRKGRSPIAMKEAMDRFQAKKLRRKRILKKEIPEESSSSLKIVDSFQELT